ncbi:hypothetical protein [Paenarthrobacter sp. NPDC091669]|uniref:hypothetical protein n=1 Tax=Paenarthrobacter sp. NPDC091669 TaxID=3364384 RepID=UPI0038014655
MRHDDEFYEQINDDAEDTLNGVEQTADDIVSEALNLPANSTPIIKKPARLKVQED